MTISLQVSLTRLGYLDVAIVKKIAKLACHLVLLIHDRGYLDVAIAKKNLTKLAKKFEHLSVKHVEIGRKSIWSLKVGVAMFV